MQDSLCSEDFQRNFLFVARIFIKTYRVWADCFLLSRQALARSYHFDVKVSEFSGRIFPAFATYRAVSVGATSGDIVVSCPLDFTFIHSFIHSFIHYKFMSFNRHKPKCLSCFPFLMERERMSDCSCFNF